MAPGPAVTVFSPFECVGMTEVVWHDPWSSLCYHCHHCPGATMSWLPYSILTPELETMLCCWCWGRHLTSLFLIDYKCLVCQPILINTNQTHPNKLSVSFLSLWWIARLFPGCSTGSGFLWQLARYYSPQLSAINTITRSQQRSQQKLLVISLSTRI